MLGKLLIYSGIAAVILGLVLSYAPWALSWFGRLPGDIRIERENSFIFIPVTSMLVVSIALSIAAQIFRR